MTTLIAFLSQFASAHEAYLLTHDEFWRGQQIVSNPVNDFVSAMLGPQYFSVTMTITAIMTVLFILNFFLAASRAGHNFDQWIKKAIPWGLLVVRLAISTSLFFAAFENSLFGPEVSLANIPDGVVIRFLEILTGLLVLFGVLMEVAGLIGMAIYLYMFRYYGIYMLTYLNYFGEWVVLFLFGQRFLTLDSFFLGQDKWLFNLNKFKKFEVPIVRLFYGLALIFAGISIKFLHQNLSVTVYDEYHLQNFFRASGTFIASGAGLSEVLIGLFILLGFGMRLTIIISTIFITLSLIYFQELIWPHFLLYGLSFVLFVNAGGYLTIDHFLVNWLRRILRIKV